MNINEDFSHYVIEKSKIKTLGKPPERSDWECQIFGGPMGLTFVPTKGNEPNWFHREMQELCFGFKWRKKVK